MNAEHEHMILQDLCVLSRFTVPARWVEAWMLFGIGQATMDTLANHDRYQFFYQVQEALECVDASTPEYNESLATIVLGPARYGDLV
jgi:hypothetical protein